MPFVSEWAHDTAGDADLGIVFHSGKEWVKVSKGEQVCGYLSIVANHGCYVEVHPFISTSVKGQGVKILQKFIDWLDSWLPTCYGSIITKSPETYKHIEKIAYFLNFKKIGEINAEIWLLRHKQLLKTFFESSSICPLFRKIVSTLKGCTYSVHVKI